MFKTELVCAASAAILLGAAACSADEVRRVVSERVDTRTASETHASSTRTVVTASEIGASGAVLNTAPVGDCPAGVFPGEQWAPGDPQALGWDGERLERAREIAEKSYYAAGMLIHQGRVIWRFGDLDRPYETRSIRKSLYNPLLGQAIAEGRLDLGSTLAELGIDDKPPLTDREKRATVRDVIMSRSGVYHDAAHMTRGDHDERPPRGAYGPGEHFWYNNWDFNVSAVIAENAIGENLFAAFDRRVAKPIGMQDYRPNHGRKHYELKASIHPAYLMDMSARDRARFGWLYLNDGCWNGKRIVPAGWAAISMSPLTDRSASNSPDYGYLWASQSGVGDMQGRLIMAKGNAHQYITLIPESGAVLVLVNEMVRPGWWNWVRIRTGMVAGFEDYKAVLREVVNARPRAASPTTPTGSSKPTGAAS